MTTNHSDSRKKKITASELMDQLQRDPVYLSRTQETERRRQESIEQHRLVAAPVVEGLNLAGFRVDSIDDLRRSGTHYSAAVPVLLKWLPRIANEDVKESIVRALSVPWAKPTATLPLIYEFRAAPLTASGLKWAIGNALEVIADDSVFDQISEIVRDRKHGKAREMLAMALGNMTHKRAVELLIELLKDDEVAGHALIALGKLRDQKARPYIEKLLSHQKAWVRKEAKKALTKLDQ